MYSLGGSTFTGSMMTDVTLYSGMSSMVAQEKKEQKIDPTKPNDHPILKVPVWEVQDIIL